MPVKILFAIFFINNVLDALAQDKPSATALNRITLNRADTVYQFFVNKPPKKLEVQSSINYHWFSPDTILVSQGSFGEKLLDGTYKVFYPNKNLKEEGSFKNGLKTGAWKTWTPGGILLSVITWNKGKRNGAFEEYGESGQLIRSGVYKDDLLSGELIEYQGGQPKTRTNYKQGKVVEVTDKKKPKQTEK